MPAKPRISVTIITLNEADNIRECLESARWADEIVVVDSGSTDATRTICREYTDNVYEADWPGFGIQKNRAIDYATGDWVLSLDADERITPELRAEIETAVSGGQYDAYSMPRLSSYCGQFMRHGGWWPDRVVRLFRRGRARFTNALVHERVESEGPVGALSSPLIHHTYRDFTEVLQIVDRYSSAGAEAMYERGRRAGLFSAIGHGLWAFLRAYVVRRGFLDGRRGFMLAVSNAEQSYYKYLKLWFLHASNQRSETTGRRG